MAADLVAVMAHFLSFANLLIIEEEGYQLLLKHLQAFFAELLEVEHNPF